MSLWLQFLKESKDVLPVSMLAESLRRVGDILYSAGQCMYI